MKELILVKNLVGSDARIKGILTPPLCPLDCWQSAPAALCCSAGDVQVIDVLHAITRVGKDRHYIGELSTALRA